LDNGEQIKYMHGLIKVRHHGQEFLMFPGETLTKVPVQNLQNFSRLYLLWLRYAPEFWRRRRVRRSHLAFLKKCHAMTAEIEAHFRHLEILAASSRVIDMPSTDPVRSRRTIREERRKRLNKIIRDAIKEHNGPDNAPRGE
jgi:hypothetical protein